MATLLDLSLVYLGLISIIGKFGYIMSSNEEMMVSVSCFMLIFCRIIEERHFCLFSRPTLRYLLELS